MRIALVFKAWAVTSRSNGVPVMQAEVEQLQKVPGTGIEPALSCDNQILSLTRLPVPPSGHGSDLREAKLIIFLQSAN